MLRPYTAPYKPKKSQSLGLPYTDDGVKEKFGQATRRFRKPLRILTAICAIVFLTSDLVFYPIEQLLWHSRNLCAYFLGDLTLDSFWEEAFPALASYLPTDVTALPPGEIGFVITLPSCPENAADNAGFLTHEDPGDSFYDAAAVLKYSIEKNLNTTGKYTATLHAIVHHDAIFCLAPTGEQYDRVRVLESLGYHVQIKGSPIVAETGDFVNITAPYIAENVNNDAGANDLITVYAAEIQNQTAIVITDLDTTFVQPLDPVLDDFINNPTNDIVFSITPPQQQEPIIITQAPTQSPVPTISPTTKPPTPAPVTEAPTAMPVTGMPTTAAPTTLSPTPVPTTASPTQSPTTAAPTPSPTTAAPTPLPTPAPTQPTPTLAPEPVSRDLLGAPALQELTNGTATIDQNTLIIINPDPTLTENLTNFFTNLTYDPATGWGGSGVGNFSGALGFSGILSYYYATQKPEKARVLDPCKYGNGKHHKCAEDPTTQPKVMNLNKCGSPWSCPDKKTLSEGEKEQCRQAAKIWYEARKNFEEDCFINAPGSDNKGTFNPDVALGYCEEEGKAGYNRLVDENSLGCNKHRKEKKQSHVLHYMKNGRTKHQAQTLVLNTGESTRRKKSCLSVKIEKPSLFYNIALVIDSSGSACDAYTGGSKQKDLNNDKKQDTILDASLAGVLNFLESMCDVGDLGNHNVKIGVVSFQSSATYHGVFEPCNPDALKTVNTPLRGVLTGLQCGGDSDFSDALAKTISFFQHDVDWWSGINSMFFLSDGKASPTGFWGGSESQHGSNFVMPHPVSKYTDHLEALDWYDVHRVCVGVGSHAETRSDFDLDRIDNTPEGPSSRGIDAVLIHNPMVGKLVNFEVIINGKKIESISAADVIDTPTGWELPEQEVEGFDPYYGSSNDVEVKAYISSDSKDSDDVPKVVSTKDKVKGTLK